MRMLSTMIALAVASVSSTPAVAREWPSAGGWEIAESGTDACLMAMEYAGEGDTIFAVRLDINGNVVGFATNTAWSAKKDEEYDLSYELNDYVYSGVKSIGIGDYRRREFGVPFRPEFLTDFAKASGLRIKMGETIVDDLKLTGSAAGIQRLRQCVAHVKGVATAAAREKARFNHIIKDPFAASPPQGSSAVSVQARALANLPSLFSDEDYPASALRNREECVVDFKLEVGANGRVTKLHDHEVEFVGGTRCRNLSLVALACSFYARCGRSRSTNHLGDHEHEDLVVAEGRMTRGTTITIDLAPGGAGLLRRQPNKSRFELLRGVRD